jgi:hypothetical protein
MQKKKFENCFSKWLQFAAEQKTLVVKRELYLPRPLYTYGQNWAQHKEQ